MLARKRNLLIALVIFFAQASCHSTNTRNRIDEKQFPRVILWAWERPENLEFLDPQRYAVAFLAQTLILKGGDVVYDPRHQPLKVVPSTKLIAVTRIESQKITHERPELSHQQQQQLVERIRKTLELPNVTAVQIDFDAVSSERPFYRELLEHLRRELPDNVPLSMTALASFCIGDRWLNDLPVDEAVPMIFRMGADADHVKRFLASGSDFREVLCRRSYGVALNETVTNRFEKERRIYVFNDRPWLASDLPLLEERFSK
jgi:hypothetical protein